MDVDIEPPEKRMHDAYEIERNTMAAEMEDAMNIVGAGNPLTPAKRRAISLPGTAMPDGILKGMYEIRQSGPGCLPGLLGEDVWDVRHVETVVEGQ